VFTLLAAPLPAEAQQSGKVPRVGVLLAQRGGPVQKTTGLFQGPIESFPRGLRDLGYVEGRDVIIEWRDAEGHYDRVPALAADLVRLGVNVIVAVGPEARLVAMKATSTIPIVATGADPVGEGWAASLARPGGNVTGLTVSVPELAGKRMQLATEIVPRLSRLAVLGGPTYEQPFLRQSLLTEARSLGVQVQLLDVQRPDDLTRALDDALRHRAQAVYVAENFMLYTERARVADLAAQRRLPTIGWFRHSAEAGYLLTYGVDLGDLWRRAATYVDKILKGVRAGDLPIEQPTKFDLVINLKTAKTLGLTIPPSVLARADHVIE
jgi:putative tryptophan/tyrosine transport system substrate-binding protein